MFEQAEAGKSTFDVCRRGLPERGNRLVGAAGRMGMEYPVVPTTRADGKFRVVPHHVKQRSDRADKDRLGVLRHHQHLTALLLPDFPYKLVEVFRARQIQNATRLASVPVSSRDNGAPPALGQMDDIFVLFGA